MSFGRFRGRWCTELCSTEWYWLYTEDHITIDVSCSIDTICCIFVYPRAKCHHTWFHINDTIGGWEWFYDSYITNDSLWKMALFAKINDIFHSIVHRLFVWIYHKSNGELRTKFKLWIHVVIISLCVFPVWSPIHSGHMVKSCWSISLVAGTVFYAELSIYIWNFSNWVTQCRFIFLQVISQIGAFFGRSSLSYIPIDEIWPLNLLIATFTMYFAFEAIFMTVPIIWVIFIFVFFVGFTSGCTLLNVYYRLTNETPARYQVFALCSASMGISVGVITAAGLAIPIHSAICKLPAPL